MRGLHGWIRLLEGSQSAVLAALLKELDRITTSSESSAIQLADIILKDASLTSNIIRIGNSVQFNPSPIAVTTVSRAILNIGFKNIRSFCLSIKVLETVLKDSPSPVLVTRLATVLHGAAQSKALCDDLPDYKQEEVFVASLLSHLSELLVLGSDESDAKEYKSEVDGDTTSEDKNQVAERVLGVSFTRLSKTLMKQWRIEGLINDVLKYSEQAEGPVRAIQLGDEIAQASRFGWDSPEFKEVLKRVAAYKNASEKEIKQAIIATADETEESIKQFGKAVLNGQIPTSRRGVTRPKNGEGQKSANLLKPNQEIQLKVLQELTTQLMGEFNINTIFKTILTGLHQGVGLERVALVIFDKSNQKLVAKYVQGAGTQNWREAFVVNYVKSLSGFLHNLFETDKPSWIGNDGHRQISQYLTPEYKGITGTDKFLIAPLNAKGKKIGFLYADMGESNRELSQSNFDGFCHFYQQIRLALSILASR